VTTLQDYITQVQDLIHDLNAIDFSIPSLITKINQARVRAALDLHCCRNFYDGLQFVPGQERYPLSGGVAGIKLLEGGDNYVSPQVVFTGGGGMGASATIAQINGECQQPVMTSWGQGYTSTPNVNIIDGAGWITNFQVRKALAALALPLNAIDLVVNAILVLPVTDPINIQWNSGAPTLPGDPLYLLISNSVPLTNAQTEALYQNAGNFGDPTGTIPFGAATGQTSGSSGGQTVISTGAVSNQQIRLAASTVQYGFINALANSIPSSPADPANIIWNSSATSSPGDPLSLVMVNTLGMTVGQMQAFYTFAATMPESPQTVTNQQFRLALAASGFMLTFIGALSANLSDPANIQWFSGAGTKGGAGDPIYNLLNTITSPGPIYTAAALLPANQPGRGAVAQAVALRNVVDWDAVSVIWGTERPMLGWLPWSAFQAYARLTQSVPQGRPVMWTSFPENNYAMFFRIPDQVYGLEISAITIPDPLISLTDVETQILPPNDDAVQWYAAHLCLLKLQQFGPAMFYSNEDARNPGKYQMRVQSINGSKIPPRTPNIYASTGARISKWFGGG
jgi:hypothetical protein